MLLDEMSEMQQEQGDIGLKGRHRSEMESWLEIALPSTHTSTI